MSELHFEIAAADEAAVKDREYFLTIFDLPGPVEGGPKETYAAVRPASDSWLALSRTVFVAKRSQEDTLVASMKFLDQCFIEGDLRKALIQAIDKEPDQYKAYRPDDADELGDPDLSDFGVLVAQSNKRLNDRLFDSDDLFGSSTLVGIMESLTQRWSANPYWVTAALFDFAASQWQTLDGLALSEGVDLIAILNRSPSRFLNLVKFYWLRGKTDNDKAAIENKLNAPPPWQGKRSREQLKADGKGFLAAMADINAKQSRGG